MLTHSRAAGRTRPRHLHQRQPDHERLLSTNCCVLLLGVIGRRCTRRSYAFVTVPSRGSEVYARICRSLFSEKYRRHRFPPRRDDYQSRPRLSELEHVMRMRVNVLAIGLVLLGTTAAGCSSTTSSSSGAAQDDVGGFLPGASSPASSAPASAEPAPASAEPAPASSPAELPLLGSSVWVVCDSGLAYACGDPGPGGGVVFFADSKGFTEAGSVCGSTCHFLEAQTVSVGTVPWCVGSGASDDVQPNTTTLGAGYSNTQAMLQVCTSGAANSAVTPIGGLSDWFLPSQDELWGFNGWSGPGVLCGFGAGLVNASTWTSSENGKSAADWAGSGDLGGSLPKSTPEAVCPIRAFSS